MHQPERATAPGETTQRLQPRSAAHAVALLVLALLLSSCAVLDDEADATWDLAPGQAIDARTTSFTADVSRVGCNSGETGSVNDPEITVEDDRIVIAFTVSPGEPRNADCQGNLPVSYEVELPEPLGDRELVDPACIGTSISDGDACTDGGVRYPRRG